MKKIVSIMLLAVMSAALFSGCVSVNFNGLGVGVGLEVRGDGVPQVFEFSVGDISEIHVMSLCNVEYYASPSDVVTLEIQPNLLEYYIVEESGGVLTIKSAVHGVRFVNVKTPVLTVGSSALTHVSFQGAGNFTAHDTIRVDSFDFHLSGAGDADIDIDTDSFSSSLAGAGNLTLSGRADVASFNLSGAGKVEALELQSREADVSLSGAGTVRISASEKLDVAASGVGSVEYRGSPASLNIQRSGVVTVRQID